MKQIKVLAHPAYSRLPSLWRGRTARAACAAALSLALLLLLGAVALAARSSAPSVPGQAQVIVQAGDNEVAARNITVSGSVSGLQALTLTGLRVVTTTTNYGAAVCSIQGVGCPASDCFCDPDRYWSYNYWDGHEWQSYQVGPGSSTVVPGAIEGWRWGTFGTALAAPQPITAALHALDWLGPRQSLVDGGYGGDSGSVEALFAIGANDYMAAGWQRNATAPSLQHYEMRYAARYAAQGAAEAGKTAVALAATSTCWPQNAKKPADYYDAATGAYYEGAGPHAWAMLGTAALGRQVPAEAVAYLKGLVQPNGGWEWGKGWGADTNATALALQALIAAGEPVASPVVAHGLAYLQSMQKPDGGFPYGTASIGTESDADSTAYVLQALQAAGVNPLQAPWVVGGKNPVSYLLSAQLPDGSFEWQPGTGSSELSTDQVTVALLGRPFPLKVNELAPCRSLYLPSVKG